MTQQHPITPPPELIEDWIEIAKPEPWKRPPDPNVLCTLAAQWGADQELEACCEWLDQEGWSGESRQLCAARRPKPPSLKEQALAALNEIEDSYGGPSTQEILIRRALEQLPDHE
jgi:predicted secreted protein